MSKKVLIIGFGSIGKRHANVYKELGASVAVLSKRDITWGHSFSELNTALRKFKPDIVLIANQTGKHIETLRGLKRLNYVGNVVIEKPVFDKAYSIDVESFSHCVVAYNFRFHPVLNYLKNELKGKKVISSHIYCGQYLPTWRPHVDYRKTYSSSKCEGGGVLRDLSHELDYAYWLFGEIKRLTALGGQLSSLEVDSDDSISILMEAKNASIVNISINYLDRINQRRMTINCDDSTYEVDLLISKIVKNSDVVMNLGAYNQTYHDQAKSILKEDFQQFCSFSESLKVLKFIDIVEKSIKDQSWEVM